MPWTEITRAQYQREGLRFASDMTDAEWALIARRLGWRPEFPWGRLTAWQDRTPGIRFIERRPMPPLGHFSLIRYGKGNGAAA